jgi:hypothetical protein
VGVAGQREIAFVFLSRVQPKDGVQPEEQSPQVGDFGPVGLAGWPPSSIAAQD